MREVRSWRALLEIFYVGFVKIGGMQQLRILFPYAVADTTLRNTTECGIPDENYFSLIRPFDADLPWFGLIFGSAVVSVWYWSCDQVRRRRSSVVYCDATVRSSCNEHWLPRISPMPEPVVSLRVSLNFYPCF